MKLPYQSMHRSPGNTDPIEPVESIKNNEFSEDNLSRLTVITDDIAKKIANLDFDDINLDNLNNLSEEAARHLIKHVGTTSWNERGRTFLSLNGLKSLDDNLAEILSQYKGALSLGGLTQISDETAMHLAKIKHNLILSGLTEISEKSAEYLSEHKGHWKDAAPLYLDGLNKISDEVAKHLGNHQGHYLSLNGLTEISEKSAEYLSKAEGILFLNGLREITEPAAEGLSKQKGILYLNGLINISQKAADSLDSHKGMGTMSPDLYVDNLEKSLSEEELFNLLPKHFSELEQYLKYYKEIEPPIFTDDDDDNSWKKKIIPYKDYMANREIQIIKRQERLKLLNSRSNT